MKIESIRLKNFKAFKNTLMSDIPKLSVIVGANGSGKSTFFDVFDFLKEAYKDNISQALDRRGGFGEVKSRNSVGPIEIEIKFSDSSFKQPITYFIAIEEENGRPIIEREKLEPVVDFSKGQGFVVTNEPKIEFQREEQTLARPDILAIKGLAQFQKFPVIMKLGSLIENWHISDFNINSAKQIQEHGSADHLSREGENLSLVTHRLYERYPTIFNDILEKLKQRVPGINSVAAKVTEEGRVLLKFKEGHFKDPFLARHQNVCLLGFAV